MKPKSLALAFALAAALAVFMAKPAQAESINFTISGVGITASGSLTVTPVLGDVDLITGLTGTQNGQTMTLLGIGGFDGNDNVLYADSSLDVFGFSFAAGGKDYKVYFNDLPLLLGGSESYYETSVLGGLGQKVSFVAPEPPSYLLLAIGLLGLLVMTPRKLVKPKVYLSQ